MRKRLSKYERVVSAVLRDVLGDAYEQIAERIAGELAREDDDAERPKRSNPLPKVLSRDDVRRLLAQPDWRRARTGLRNRVAMQLMYRCGLRASEVCALTPAHVRLDEGYLIIQHAKGDKDRTVPMDPETIMWCRRWLEKRPESPWFLPTLQGGRMSEHYVYRMVTREARAAGVYIQDGAERKPAHPHTLRHCYATELLEEGYSIVEVQQLLGHSSVAITQIYTHVRPAALAQRIRQRPALEV